jgi:hypothetical protein
MSRSMLGAIKSASTLRTMTRKALLLQTLRRRQRVDGVPGRFWCFEVNIVSDQNLHPAFLLAEKVIEARNNDGWYKVMKGQFSTDIHLLDEAVHRLVRLAYDASLMEEEGRFPIVRLVCTNSAFTVGFGHNPPWDSPQIATADHLRKLAPTAKRPGSALVMRPIGVDIRCVGVCEFAEIIDPIAPHIRNPSWEMPTALGAAVFTVRIESPGRIRASFLPAKTFLLHGGEIKECNSWADKPAVFGLIKDAATSLVARVGRMGHPLLAEVRPRECEFLLAEIFGHLLTLTTGARRGGAFIVPLEDPGDGVQDGHFAHLDVCEVIAGAIEDCLRIAGDNWQASWRGRRRTVFNAAEQLAGLSAVQFQEAGDLAEWLARNIKVDFGAGPEIPRRRIVCA